MQALTRTTLHEQYRSPSSLNMPAFALAAVQLCSVHAPYQPCVPCFGRHTSIRPSHHPLPPGMYMFSLPRLCETRQCCSLSPAPAAARSHAARGLAFFQNQWRHCRSASLRGLAPADVEPTSLPMAVAPSVELHHCSEPLAHVIDDGSDTLDDSSSRG